MDWIFSWWTIGGLTGSIIAAFAAAWFLGFGPVIIAFLQTKIGRTLAMIGAGILAIMWVLAKVFAAGRAKEKESVRQNSIKKDEQRAIRDEELKNLDDAALRKRTDRWLSD